MADSSNDDDTYEFLGYISLVDNANCWLAEILIDGETSTFQLDTGASVIVFGESRTEPKKPNPANQSVKDSGNTALVVVRTSSTTLSYKDMSIKETIFVSADQFSGLLIRSD